MRHGLLRPRARDDAGEPRSAIATLGLPEARASRYKPWGRSSSPRRCACLRCLRRPIPTVRLRRCRRRRRRGPAPSSAAASLVTAAQTCLAVFAAFALHSADEQLNLLQRSQEVVFSRARTAQPAPQAAERVRAQLYEHARQLRALTPALQAWAEAALEDESVNAPDVRRRVLLPLVEIGTIATRSAAQVEVDAEGAVAAAPAALTAPQVQAGR